MAPSSQRHLWGFRVIFDPPPPGPNCSPLSVLKFDSRSSLVSNKLRVDISWLVRSSCLSHIASASQVILLMKNFASNFTRDMCVPQIHATLRSQYLPLHQIHFLMMQEQFYGTPNGQQNLCMWNLTLIVHTTCYSIRMLYVLSRK